MAYSHNASVSVINARLRQQLVKVVSDCGCYDMSQFLVRHNQLITSVDTEYPIIMEYLRRTDPRLDE